MQRTHGSGVHPEVTHLTDQSENAVSEVLALFSEVQRIEGETLNAVCYGAAPIAGSLSAAQFRFLQQVKSVIDPENNGCLVLAGPSLGPLATDLATSRDELKWLVPDYFPSQLGANSETTDHAIAAPAIGAGPAGLASLKAGSCATVIIEGTVPYLDQLALLAEAKRILTATGQLVLFGEYLDDDTRIERSALANLTSIRQLSERLGFQLQQEQDCSESALASVQVLLEKSADLRQQILAANTMDASALQSAIEQLRFIERELKEGRRTLRIFSFKRDSQARGEYANAEYGDIDSFAPIEIKTLFEESFNTEFDQDQWQWKYQQGNGRCVVARAEPGGHIVSHYGGAPRDILYFGEPNVAIQVCDVMVLPEIRRHYGKQSLFFKTAATFLEREIGFTVRQLLGFGFPNQKAMNIALRLGLYEKTDDFVELIYQQPENSEPQLLISPADLEDVNQAAEVDALWGQMAPAFSDGIVGLRDSTYLKYRFFQHPFYKRGLQT